MKYRLSCSIFIFTFTKSICQSAQLVGIWMNVCLKNNIKTPLGAKTAMKIKRTTFTGSMKLKNTPQIPILSLTRHFDANFSILWRRWRCIVDVYLLCILLCDMLQKISVSHALVSLLDPSKHSHVVFPPGLSSSIRRLSSSRLGSITQAVYIETKNKYYF